MWALFLCSVGFSFAKKTSCNRSTSAWCQIDNGSGVLYLPEIFLVQIKSLLDFPFLTPELLSDPKTGQINSLRGWTRRFLKNIIRWVLNTGFYVWIINVIFYFVGGHTVKSFDDYIGGMKGGNSWRGGRKKESSCRGRLGDMSVGAGEHRQRTWNIILSRYFWLLSSCVIF